MDLKEFVEKNDRLEFNLTVDEMDLLIGSILNGASRSKGKTRLELELLAQKANYWDLYAIMLDQTSGELENT